MQQQPEAETNTGSPAVQTAQSLPPNFLDGNFFKSPSAGNLETNLEFNSDCEEISLLTSTLQSLSNGLSNLKSFIQQQDAGSKDKKTECQRKLSDVFLNLQDLFQHHPMIKSAPILTSAASLIDKFKKGNFDDSKQEKEDLTSSIDSFATSLTNCVSEYWLEREFGSTNSQLPSKAKSMELLSSMEPQSKRSSSDGSSSPATAGGDGVDVLFKLESGVEMSFQRAQAWSKYAKEIITYIERRNNLYGEFSRNLSKLAKSVQQNISEDSFQPFQSLFCKALSKDIEMCNMGQAARSLIHNQLFVLPMNSRRSEHEKTRKELKNHWSRQVKKMHDAESNLRKAKATYISRQQEHEKLKEQALRAETESLNQNWTGTKNEAKAEKKRKQEDEALQKAMDAETTYKQCIVEANNHQNLLEQTKVSVLNNMKQLLYDSDRALKKATMDYFKLMNTITDTIPQNFQQMFEESSLYSPGSHYSDYLKQIRTKDCASAVHKHYIFEPYVPHTRYNEAPLYTVVEPSINAYQASLRIAPVDDSDSISGESSVSMESSPGASPFQPHRKKTGKDCTGLMSPGLAEDDEFQGDTAGDFNMAATFRGMKLSSAAQTHVLKKLRAPSKCCECSSYVYFNGAECDRCRLISHKKCLEVLKISCGDSRLTNLGDVSPQSPSTVTFPLQSVPFLVTKCINEMDHQGLHIKGVYRVSAVKSKVEQLCQNFDADEKSIDLSDQNPNVVANVLKLYLRKLPEPLLTFKLYPVFINIAKNEVDLATTRAALKQAVDQLPFANYRTCAILFNHLNRVSKEHHVNQMTASNLGIVFGPTLLRPREMASVTHLVDTPFQSKAVELLIENVEDVFGLTEAAEKPKSSLLVRSTSATLSGDISPGWLPSNLTGDLLNELVKEVPHFQKMSEDMSFSASNTSTMTPPSSSTSFTADRKTTEDQRKAQSASSSPTATTADVSL